MKKILLTALLVMATVAMAACGEKAPKSYSFGRTDGFDTLSFSSVDLFIESDYMEDSEKDWAAYRVEEAERAVAEFLGANYIATDAYEQSGTSERIRCYVKAGTGTSMAVGQDVTLYYAKEGAAPYTNLICQAKAGMTIAPDWLREGLGAYVADLNKESLLNTYARNLHELKGLAGDSKESFKTIDVLAKTLLKAGAYPDALEMGDLSLGIAQAAGAEAAFNYRGAYCVYAGAFVKYLDETYGRDKLLQVYNGGDAQAVLGKTIETIRGDWQASLQG